MQLDKFQGVDFKYDNSLLKFQPKFEVIYTRSFEFKQILRRGFQI